MKKREIFFTALGILLLLCSAFLVSAPKLKRYAESVGCVNYMSSICCGATMWADDNDKRMPTNFISMTNLLATPQFLVCPGDHTRQAATKWASFTIKNTSYQIIAPAIFESDTNIAYLQCTIHTNHLGYAYGYVFDGKRMRTKRP